MAVSDEGECLIELCDLREIELTISNTRQIGIKSPCDNIAQFLVQNKDLQRVDIYLEDGYMAGVVWNAIGSLKNLSDLTIKRRMLTRLNHYEDYVIGIVDLLKQIGPQLKTLPFEISDSRSRCLYHSAEKLNNLKELKLLIETNDTKDLIEDICRLKSLRTLRIHI